MSSHWGSLMFLFFSFDSFLVLCYILSPEPLVLKKKKKCISGTVSLAAASTPRLSQAAPYSHSNLWAFGWVPLAQTKGCLPRSPTCYLVNKELHTYAGPSPLTIQRQSWRLILVWIFFFRSSWTDENFQVLRPFSKVWLSNIENVLIAEVEFLSILLCLHSCHPCLKCMTCHSCLPVSLVASQKIGLRPALSLS